MSLSKIIGWTENTVCDWLRLSNKLPFAFLLSLGMVSRPPKKQIVQFLAPTNRHRTIYAHWRTTVAELQLRVCIAGSECLHGLDGEMMNSSIPHHHTECVVAVGSLFWKFALGVVWFPITSETNSTTNNIFSNPTSMHDAETSVHWGLWSIEFSMSVRRVHHNWLLAADLTSRMSVWS